MTKPCYNSPDAAFLQRRSDYAKSKGASSIAHVIANRVEDIYKNNNGELVAPDTLLASDNNLFTLSD